MKTARDELTLLLESYRDDAMDATHAERLADVLQAEDEACAWVMEEIEFTGILSQALDDRDDMAFLRSFFERSSAEYPIAKVDPPHDSQRLKARLGPDPAESESDESR